MLAEVTFGKYGKAFVNIGTVFSHMGAAAVFIDFSLIHFRNFAIHLAPSLIEIHQLYFSIIFGALFFGFALIRRIHAVAKVAALGNYLVIMSMLYLCITCFIHIYRGEVVKSWSCPPTGEDSACFFIELDKFPSFFGTAVFAFASSTFVLPVRDRYIIIKFYK